MNKEEYIAALINELQALPETERQEAVQYYREYFDDAGEGKESEVIAELGSPQELAKFILKNFSCVPQSISQGNNSEEEKKLPEKKSNQEEQSKGAKILLLVLLAIITLPIWGSVLATVLSFVFGLFMAVIGIGVGLVVLSVVAFVLGLMLVAIAIGIFFSDAVTALFCLGIGLLISGLGVLFIIGGSWLCAKVLPRVIQGMVKLCRKPFERKEGVA